MASSLQCFGCGAEFGFFKREHGCNNCGRLFCYFCTTKTIVLPNKGNKKQKVCDKCYKELTRPSNANNKGSEKQSLNDLSQGNQTIKSSSVKVAVMNIPVDEEDGAVAPSATKNSKTQCDPDEQIQQRLQKLKDDGQHRGTDADIGKKFEELTGRKAISMQPSSDLLKPRPRKTETEQTSDLIKQMKDECAVDSGGGIDTTDAPTKDLKEEDEVDALIRKAEEECRLEGATALADQDIEARLAKLKDIDPSSYKTPAPMGVDSDDEEEMNRRYLKQVLGEALLEDKTESLGYDPSSIGNQSKNSMDPPKLKKGKASQGKHNEPTTSIFSKDYEADSDDDELPWCCICSANAVLRCHGCDDDLYCKRCYREGHSKDDYDDHEVSSFRPKKGKKR